ncbi:MAG TPA: MBL fold metallo-hydrolase, partial [Trueperaceae bacterium]|nr:MBL fold metallo-hydrolase [Trueperaceae bacterium]
MDKYSNIPKVQNFDGIYLLDSLHMGNSGTVGVYLLPAKDGSNNFALIETGPGSTLNNIKDAIFEAGFKLENLKDILVTHIHLDHAGAAGALAAQTGAKVYVHEIGYKHLNDP